jgi:hypothetical protein
MDIILSLVGAAPFASTAAGHFPGNVSAGRDRKRWPSISVDEERRVLRETFRTDSSNFKRVRSFWASIPLLFVLPVLSELLGL